MKSKSPQPAANKDSLDHVKDALQVLAAFLTGIATTEKRDWALSIGYLLTLIVCDCGMM